MIKKFKVLRTIPEFNLDLIVVFVEKKSFYCAVPCDVQLSNDNVRDWKISNCLYEHLLFIDFKNVGS